MEPVDLMDLMDPLDSLDPLDLVNLDRPRMDPMDVMTIFGIVPCLDDLMTRLTILVLKQDTFFVIVNDSSIYSSARSITISN